MYDRRVEDKYVTDHQLQEELRLIEIENTIKQLEEKIDTLARNVDDLVTAWKAAAWLVSVVKWLGGLAIAGTAIITFMKGR